LSLSKTHLWEAARCDGHCGQQKTSWIAKSEEDQQREFAAGRPTKFTQTLPI
jgi:hypothetical protein